MEERKEGMNGGKEGREERKEEKERRKERKEGRKEGKKEKTASFVMMSKKYCILNIRFIPYLQSKWFEPGRIGTCL